ncbi:MAG: dihydrodipicolinate synthase family protein [Acetobacteraceae bacterium]
MAERIEGLWVALPTPLQDDSSVDHATLVRHSQRMLREGCDGLVPFGTTGEGPSFSAAERIGAVEALLAAGILPGQIALGVGCPAVPDMVALTRSALGLGLQHVLALPPFFFRDATPAGIEDAFAAMIDRVADARLRLTLYHIPQVSGLGVPAGALAGLRARYGELVAGVKDSSGVFADFQAFRAAAPEAAITVGSEADIGRAMASGGAGTICGMVNLAPRLVRAMFTDQDAEGPMRRAVALIEGAFVPTLKSVVAAQSGAAGWSRVRPPLRAADPALGERIARTLHTMQTPVSAA